MKNLSRCFLRFKSAVSTSSWMSTCLLNFQRTCGNTLMRTWLFYAEIVYRATTYFHTWFCGQKYAETHFQKYWVCLLRQAAVPCMKACGCARLTAYDELVSLCCQQSVWCSCSVGWLFVALVLLLIYAYVFQAVLLEQHFQAK